MLRATSVVLALVMNSAVAAAGNGVCAQFDAALAHEKNLLAGAAKTIGGSPDAGSAPSIRVNRAYDVILMPEDEVRFAAPRGTELLSTGGYGGLLKITVPKAGRYRVSLDQPFWLDMLARRSVIAPRDSQTNEDCNPLRKFVDYDLPGGTELIIQLSGNANTRVRLTVTAIRPARG